MVCKSVFQLKSCLIIDILAATQRLSKGIHLASILQILTHGMKQSQAFTKYLHTYNIIRNLTISGLEHAFLSVEDKQHIIEVSS